MLAAFKAPYIAVSGLNPIFSLSYHIDNVKQEAITQSSQS